MNKEMKAELTKIVEGLKVELETMQTTVVSNKGKAQIKNLIDKVDVRQKLPNFSIRIPANEENTFLTLSEFLHAINVEASKDEKENIKNLEIRIRGLELTLEK